MTQVGVNSIKVPSASNPLGNRASLDDDSFVRDDKLAGNDMSINFDSGDEQEDSGREIISSDPPEIKKTEVQSKAQIPQPTFLKKEVPAEDNQSSLSVKTPVPEPQVEAINVTPDPHVFVPRSLKDAKKLEEEMRLDPAIQKLDKEMQTVPNFKSVSTPFPTLELALCKPEHSREKQPILGTEFVCLRSDDLQTIRVYSLISSDKPPLVISPYLLKKGSRIISTFQLMDHVTSNSSILLVVIVPEPSNPAEAPHLLAYLLNHSQFSARLCQISYALPSMPARILCRGTWIAIQEPGKSGAFYLYEVLRKEIELIESGKSDSKPLFVLRSGPITIDNVVDSDISPVDGLLLLSTDKCLWVASQAGKKKVSVVEIVEGLVTSRFIPNTRAGLTPLPVELKQEECFVVLESSHVEIYSIVNRKFDSFLIQKIQKFNLIEHLAGPNSAQLLPADVFISKDYIIVSRNSEYFLQIIKLEKQGNVRKAYSSARLTHDLTWGTHQFSFTQAPEDRSAEVPVCLGKLYELSRFSKAAYLSGALDDKLFTYFDGINRTAIPAPSQLPPVQQIPPQQAAPKTQQEPAKSEAQPEQPKSSRKVEVAETIPSQQSEPEQSGKPVLTKRSSQHVFETAQTTNQEPVPSRANEVYKPTPIPSTEFPNPDQLSSSLPMKSLPSVSCDPEQPAAVQADRTPSRCPDETTISVSEKISERINDTVPTPSSPELELRTTQSEPILGDRIQKFDDGVVFTANSIQQRSREPSGSQNQNSLPDSKAKQPAVETATAEPFDLFVSKLGIGGTDGDNSEQIIFKNLIVGEIRDQQSQNLSEKDRRKMSSDGAARWDNETGGVEEQHTEGASQPLRKIVYHSENLPDPLDEPIVPGRQGPDGQNSKHITAHSSEHLNARKGDQSSKISGPKKADRNDPKKKSQTKGREKEPVNGSKKYPANDKRDKYYESEFRMKEDSRRDRDARGGNDYREKDAPRREDNKIHSASPDYHGKVRSVSEESDSYIPKQVTSIQPKDRVAETNTSAQQALPAAPVPEPLPSSQQKSLGEMRSEVQYFLNNRMEEILEAVKQISESDSRAEGRIEEMVKKVIERFVEEKLIKDLKDNFNCLMSNNYNEAFEDLIVPCFEKYLIKIFDKTSGVFEKGLKYFNEKITLEERKVSQFKDNFSLILSQFSNNSKAFSKLSQDIAQLNKDVVTNHNKDVLKRISALEEAVEKISEKQDRILDVVEKLALKLKSNEEDKKVDVPPLPKETGLSQEQVKSLLLDILNTQSNMQAAPPQNTLQNLLMSMQQQPQHNLMHSLMSQPPPNPMASSLPYGFHPGQQLGHLQNPYLTQQISSGLMSASQPSLGSTTPLSRSVPLFAQPTHQTQLQHSAVNQTFSPRATGGGVSPSMPNIDEIMKLVSQRIATQSASKDDERD